MNLKKLERYLRVNLLGPGPRLIKKKNLPGRGLAKVEKHCYKGSNKGECKKKKPKESQKVQNVRRMIMRWLKGVVTNLRDENKVICHKRSKGS